MAVLQAAEVAAPLFRQEEPFGELLGDDFFPEIGGQLVQAFDAGSDLRQLELVNAGSSSPMPSGPWRE